MINTLLNNISPSTATLVLSIAVSFGVLTTKVNDNTKYRHHMESNTWSKTEQYMFEEKLIRQLERLNDKVDTLMLTQRSK